MQFKFQAPDDGVADPVRSKQATEVDTWNPPTSAATSTVLSHIVMGFALCAAAMHPEEYWRWREHIDRYGRSEDPPRGRNRDIQSGKHAPPLVEAEICGFLPLPGLSRGTPADPIEAANIAQWDAAFADYPTFGQWIASLPGKLWSALLRAREKARIRAEWEVMNDRMLRDLGVARHEVLRAARHPRRWV
jgi:uncharacterized protein YjiS (DUF1127 family)